MLEGKSNHRPVSAKLAWCQRDERSKRAERECSTASTLRRSPAAPTHRRRRREHTGRAEQSSPLSVNKQLSSRARDGLDLFGKQKCCISQAVTSVPPLVVCRESVGETKVAVDRFGAFRSLSFRVAWIPFSKIQRRQPPAQALRFGAPCSSAGWCLGGTHTFLVPATPRLRPSLCVIQGTNTTQSQRLPPPAPP